MRLALTLAAFLALSGSAFAADHWHRAHNGGQDLTEPDGTVVGMVRHKPDGWLAFVTSERGSEDFYLLAVYPTMAEAKAAVATKMNIVDSKEEQ